MSPGACRKIVGRRDEPFYYYYTEPSHLMLVAVPVVDGTSKILYKGPVDMVKLHD